VEVLLNVVTSSWFKPVLFVVLMALVAKLSMTGRGKRRKRDFDLISRRLENAGFGKWYFVDLLVYLLLAGASGLAFFGLFYGLNDIQQPDNAIFEGTSGLAYVGLAAVFAGITAPMFVYVPYVKAIHKSRYKKYILYAMAAQGIDTIRAAKTLLLPLFCIAAIVGVLGSRTIDSIVGESLYSRSVFEWSVTQRSLKQIDNFYIVERFVAPNGKDKPKLRIELKFKDGFIWSSAAVGEDYTADQLTSLGQHLYSVSGIAPEAVEYTKLD